MARSDHQGPGGRAPGEKDLGQGPPWEDEGTLNGVGVSDLDGKTRKQFQHPGFLGRSRGQPGGARFGRGRGGTQARDVIPEINRTEVKDAGDAVRLTEKATDKSTLLKVWSKGGSRYIVVDETKSAPDKKS